MTFLSTISKIKTLHCINIRKILCPFAHQIYKTGGDFRQIMNVMQQKAVDPTCILSWCVMGLSKQYS